jgi:hypothetical protein
MNHISNFRSDPDMKTAHRAAAALLICSFFHNAISFPAASLMEQEMEGDETRKVLGSRLEKIEHFSKSSALNIQLFISAWSLQYP